MIRLDTGVNSMCMSSVQLSFLQEWGDEPILLYGPVIEPAAGPGRFLEAHPAKLFLSGKFFDVPLITGITKDEFSYKALRMYSDVIC
jgi:hypothetical protein